MPANKSDKKWGESRFPFPRVNVKSHPNPDTRWWREVERLLSTMITRSPTHPLEHCWNFDTVFHVPLIGKVPNAPLRS